jgi:sialidase-1
MNTQTKIFATLVACLSISQLSAGDVIESWPASATDQHPRNSEGDTIALLDGTLLVGWTEFQKTSDFATAHIAGRRSVDRGKTWGDKFIIQKNIGKLNTMSLSFLRPRDSGELLMFVLVKNSKTDLDLFVSRSTDEALTWSEPQPVTTDDGYHIMNNARVIQLRDGRILCPVSTTPLIHSSEHPLQNVCYFSDDDGRTWQRSRDAVAVPKRGAMEPGLIERRDGSLLQIIRTQMGRVWMTESFDRGDTWNKARPWDITSPEAPSTLIPLRTNNAWLIIHNPVVDPNARSHGGRRTPLVARVSRDEGETWSKPISIEDDLKNTYSYISAHVVNNRMQLTYYVEQGQRYSLKFKSIAIADLVSDTP